jgi:hypothetical protein
MSKLLGRNYKLFSGVYVTVTAVVGDYYRVFNHSALHTTSYPFKEFEELQKTETKESLIRRYTKICKD